MEKIEAFYNITATPWQCTRDSWHKKKTVKCRNYWMWRKK
jgi:hypothetical protein